MRYVDLSSGEIPARAYLLEDGALVLSHGSYETSCYELFVETPQHGRLLAALSQDPRQRDLLRALQIRYKDWETCAVLDHIAELCEQHQVDYHHGHPRQKSVQLYKAEHWDCVATICHKGRLCVSSGNKDRDWYIYVEKAYKLGLLKALDPKTRKVQDAELDRLLLQRLQTRFHGRNGFELLKRFLVERRLPHRLDAWT